MKNIYQLPVRAILLLSLFAYLPLNIYSQCPDGLTATITSHTNELCNGSCTATATATAGLGTAPYTYSWSAGGATTASVANLCAGTYTVTVKDKNGCTATASIAITQPTPIIVTTTNGTTSVCNSSNGVISAAVSGGTSPYTYAWSGKGGNGNSVNGEPAGSYTVIVTDLNGCTASNVAFVDANSLSITFTNTNIKCNGGCTGSSVATISGGNSAFNYTWSTGATTTSISGLCVNTYTLAVSNGEGKGCFTHGSTTITQPSPISIAKYETDDMGPCNGVAAVTVSGATLPYTYAWSFSGQTKDTIKALCRGTYTVNITDNNACSYSSFVTVNYNSPLPITLTSFTATYLEQNNSVIIGWTVASQLNNREFIIEKTQDGVNYEDVATLAGAGTTPFPQSYSAIDYTPTQGTTYYRLRQIDVDGKFTTFNPVFISIANLSGSSSLTIYPNPVKDYATISYTSYNKNPLPVSIIDVLGRTVNSFILSNIQIGENNIPINTSNLLPGIYDFHVSGTTKVYDLKFIKQ